MPTETNVYSRNLKVISILFIVYWFVGAHPKDNEIVLGTLRVAVDNPERLKLVAWALLGYFAWRFLLNTKNTIRFSYKKFFYSKMLHQKYKIWCSLLNKSAFNHFATSGAFEEFISKNNDTKFFRELKAQDCTLTIPSLSNSNTPTQFGYRYQVTLSEDLPGKPKTIMGVNNEFNFNLILKFIMHVHIFSHWVISDEDAADFLLPWALFAVALVSIAIGNQDQNLPSSVCL